MVDEVLVIEPRRSESHYWKDLWRYRELFYFLAWRDLLVRYKQTAVGVAWALIRPALTMIVFTLIFGHVAKLPSDGLPYPILVIAGILPWQFFAAALSEAGASIVLNANMISKIYFPRLIVPTSAVIVSLVDLLISAVVAVFVMAWYGTVPSWRLLLLPVFTIAAFGAALGAGLLVSALNVRYRDFRYVIPFIVQLGLYVSPVGFSSSVVPEHLRLLYSINPMVGVIDGFRWAISDGVAELYWPGLAGCFIVTVVLLTAGVRYFRATERTFADVI